MRRIGFLLIAVAIALNSCDAQYKESKKEDNKTPQNMPKEDIKVNKEYDEAGNLIRFDSTYTYYYSNIDSNAILGDSIFNKFKDEFNMHYPFSYKPFFNDFFFQDSLLKYDFYKEDFFLERFRRNMEQTEKMFQDMDSIKNKYFKEVIPPEKEKEKEISL